jgi:dihydrolipoamide dehydrogenase
MKHVRKLRDRFVRGVLGGMDSWKEKFISGYAKFLDENTLEVNGEKIFAEKIIIATGSKPFIPDVLKNHQDFIITTDEFFELEDLPKRVAVIGLGVIGIELGQGLHNLGVDVIGIARRRNIAGVTDPILNEYVTRKFSESLNLSFDGITSVIKKKNSLCISTGGKEYIVDKVLVTTGRYVNYDGLDLGKALVELDDKGIPKYDPETFSIYSQPHLYLAGDNTGENQILHEASDEGRIAGYNAVNERLGFETRTPLLVTFSDPNIAIAGKSFAELKDSGLEFEIGEVLFEGQGRSIVKLKEIGMLRVYGDKDSGLLLGAELFAPDGEHLAHLLSWVISEKLDVNKVLSLPFYHPVVEEGLRTALRDLRDKLDIEKPILEIFPKQRV